jgi:transcriptional regulator HilA, main transcriptional regulator of SPI1
MSMIDGSAVRTRRPPEAAWAATPPTGACEIGPVRFDPNGVVSRAGVEIRLSPKEFQLFELLIRAKGGVVDQETIRSRLWPRQDVSYESLTRCVYGLRIALGDENHSLIITMPRRGYRLGQPVRATAEARQPTLAEKTVRTRPDAYATYLQGLHEAHRLDADHQQRAIELFTAAHAMDPDYAVPLGEIANRRLVQTNRGLLPAGEGIRLGLAACRRALAIDPHLVSALAVQGWFEAVPLRRPESGLALIERALRIEPEYAVAHMYRAWALCVAEQPTACVDAWRRATQLNPHSWAFQLGLGWSLFLAGESAESLDVLRAVARGDFEDPTGLLLASAVVSSQGFREEATALARRAVAQAGLTPVSGAALGYALAQAGRRDEARSLVARVIDAPTPPHAMRSHLAMVHAALGERSRTIELLRQARDEPCSWFAISHSDPRLGDLVNDPAIRALFDR